MTSHVDQAELLRRRREARQEKIRLGGVDRLDRITRTSRGDEGQDLGGQTGVKSQQEGQGEDVIGSGHGPLGSLTSTSTSQPSSGFFPESYTTYQSPARLSREEIRAYGALGMTKEAIRSQGGFGGAPPESERERQKRPEAHDDPEEVLLPPIPAPPQLPDFPNFPPQPRPPSQAQTAIRTNPILNLMPVLHLFASLALAFSIITRRQKDESSEGGGQDGILLPPLAWSFFLLEVVLEVFTLALGQGRGGPPFPQTAIGLLLHAVSRLSQVTKDGAVILFIVIITECRAIS